MNDSTPTHQPEASAAAWQWRKRLNQGDYNGEPYYCWSEWEALQPPYMDARELSKSDPANYEFRPLFLATQPPAAPESFYVRFAKEWITASADDRQRINEFVAGWYDGDEAPAAPVAAVGEAVGEDEPMRSRWPLDAAANMLTAYAELVRATGRYAEEHYLPEVQGVIEELRAAHGILPAASMGAK